jgi:integrase
VIALINLTALKNLPRSTKGEKRQFLWDSKITGFGAYRTSRGKVVFVYQFRISPDHPTQRLTIGKLGPLTPDQARTIAAGAALAVANAIDPIAKRREALRRPDLDESLLLKNFAQHYLEVRVDGRKLRTAKEIRACIENDVCPTLGALPISAVDIPRTEAMMKELARRSKSAPRVALVQLKAMLNYAKETHKIDRVLIDALKPPKSGKRARVLTRVEIMRFIEATHDLGGVRADAFMCLLLLLKRRDEVAGMEWREVDDINWVWTLPAERTKNATEQTIILPPALIEILQRQQPKPNLRQGFVFTLDGKHHVSLTAKMKHAVDGYMHRRIELAAAEGQLMDPLKYWVFHDLRRTASTTLRKKPFFVPPHVIEAMLHHTSSIAPLQSVYQIDSGEDEVADALVTWSNYVDTLMHDVNAWPGGKDLEPLSKEEIDARVASLRANWPKRQSSSDTRDEDG